MSKVLLSYDNALNFFNLHELEKMEPLVSKAHKLLHQKKGAGHEFLGWLDLPENFDKEEFHRIKVAAEKIKKQSEILLVIGVGGSYLGARAAIEMLNHSFQNLLPPEERQAP